MSEKELVSAQNKPARSQWKWWIVYIVGLYAATCIGVGTYLKFKANKMLLNLKTVPYTVKVKFFPLPLVSIDFAPIVSKKARIVSAVHISPYPLGIFSGQYMRFRANFGFSGQDLEGTAFLKGSLDPSMKLRSWRDLAYQIKGVSYQGFGKVHFQGYRGFVEAQRATDGRERISVKFLREKEIVCSGEALGQCTSSARSGDTSLKDILKSSWALQLEPSVLLMAAKLGESWAGKNTFSGWIDANAEHMSRLFFPVNIRLSAEGKLHSAILAKALNANLENIQKTPIPDPMARVQAFLKAIAPLSFAHKMVWNIILAKQAKAKCQVHIEQLQDAQSSVLKIATDVHWAAFLAYFAQQTPESYQNAHKLLSFALGVINKNKTLDHIHTDVMLKYNQNSLEMEDFSVNGLSFGRLVQIFFSNPEILQYLREK